MDEELKKKFTEKGLSESTIKLYLRNLRKLNDDSPVKNLKFLNSPTEIIKRLEKYAENTKRGFLITITSTLGLDTSTKAKKKLYDQYFELMMDKNKELKAVERTNTKSESQEKNWLSWEEVEKKRDELKAKVDTFTSAKEISEANYNTLLSLVVLSLYTLLPPRRNEYQHCLFVKSATGLPATTNYLDFDKSQFVFNKFKTAKKEGSVTIAIPEALHSVLSTYLKFHPLIKGKITKKFQPVPFLVYHDGNPLDKVNSITRILNKIFGKAVGSSLLRHIYLSSKYGTTLQEMKDDSKEMSHSLNQQQDYIKK